MSNQKLNVLAFGLTCGLVWGLALFFCTWWIILWQGASQEPNLIAAVYRGYSVTAAGSLIGLIWALADGFIGGTVFAWLYNFIAARVSSRGQSQA